MIFCDYLLPWHIFEAYPCSTFISVVDSFCCQGMHPESSKQLIFDRMDTAHFVPSFDVYV